MNYIFNPELQKNGINMLKSPKGLMTFKTGLINLSPSTRIQILAEISKLSTPTISLLFFFVFLFLSFSNKD